jgi:ATP-dependent helicase/nuclease subunit A
VGRRITPSGLGAVLKASSVAHAGGGAGGKTRGVLIHRLLESLPGKAPDQRAQIARAWLDQQGVVGEAADAVLAACLAVLNDPRFATLFGPSSLAEVPLVGTVDINGATRVVSGRIDRLTVDGESVWITDFKSDSAPPPDAAAAPGAYVLQLALYRRLIVQMYPGKAVKAALLWTAVPRLDVLAEAALEAMLTSVDAVPGPS